MFAVDCYSVLDDDGTQPVIIVLRATQAEMDAVLAEYDPTSGTSPSVTLTRQWARVILDARLASGAP
jgi:hypothetical protein